MELLVNIVVNFVLTLMIVLVILITCFGFKSYFIIVAFHVVVLLVVTHSFRPDGKQLAVATLDGQISFWDVVNAVQTGSVDGRHDLQVGRRVADRITANKMAGNT